MQAPLSENSVAPPPPILVHESNLPRLAVPLDDGFATLAS